MKLGFFTMPIHPLDKDWRQSLREDREAFILADQLGFIEGYVGEHATDRAENITSCAMFIASLIDATTAHQARHRHHQYAERASGRDRIADRDARSHARRPLHLRHQPRRPAVGRRSVRQSRRRPQRHVPRSDQCGAENLGERAAIQYRRQILDDQDREAGDAGRSARAICRNRCRSRIRRSW